MTMENNILQHRLAVQQNISKAFENEFDADIEKGKWQVGMTLTNSKGTFKVTGFSASTGRPTWSKVKDGGKSDESGSKQQTQNQQTSTQQNTKSEKQGLSQKDYDAKKNFWFEMVSQGSDSVEDVENDIKDFEKEISQTTDKVKIATLQAQIDGCKEGISKLKENVRKRIEALENHKKETDDEIEKLKKQIGEGGNSTRNATKNSI